MVLRNRSSLRSHLPIRTRVGTARAFSLIEILLVIAIMAILASMAVTGFGVFATGAGANASARVVLGTLEEAHARTLSAEGNTSYGVHFATTTVTMFAGETYDPTESTNEVRTLRRASITDITLSGGGSSVHFARLVGTASATGTVTVVQNADTTLSRTIVIHSTGLVEVQ